MKSPIKQAMIEDVTQRYINNLLSLWEVSQKGSAWYVQAHAQIIDISQKFGVSINDAAYVVATLSPALSWEANLESAAAFFESFFGRPRISRQMAYGTNVRKCQQYMLCQDRNDVQPSGRKVSAFYRNLLGDFSVVTLDRHAIRAARCGRRNMLAESGEQEICSQEFEIIKTAYKIAAKGVGVSVAEFQATIWVLFAKSDSR